MGQTPHWFTQTKPILEKSHLGGVILGGPAGLAVSLLHNRLATKMGHSDILLLAIGYAVAFVLSAVVTAVAAQRKQQREPAA